jgi:hypothetical protein
MARPLLLFSRKISERGTIPKVYVENELVSVIFYICVQVFQQYAGMLQQRYPELAVQGDNFPPGGYR